VEESDELKDDVQRKVLLRSVVVVAQKGLGVAQDVSLACTGFLISSQARAFDLNGAWATDADQCSKVFVKKGDQISFAQFSEEYGGGFIANGNELRSKNLKCKIRSTKRTGDTVDVRAACASEIIASSVHLHIKILDDNSLSRIFPDPDMEGIELTFHRCTM
jgi:hypothetical protein